jgi:hypothetical protein
MGWTLEVHGATPDARPEDVRDALDAALDELKEIGMSGGSLNYTGGPSLSFGAEGPPDEYPPPERVPTLDGDKSHESAYVKLPKGSETGMEPPKRSTRPTAAPRSSQRARRRTTASRRS